MLTQNSFLAISSCFPTFVTLCFVYIRLFIFQKFQYLSYKLLVRSSKHQKIYISKISMNTVHPIKTCLSRTFLSHVKSESPRQIPSSLVLQTRKLNHIKCFICYLYFVYNACVASSYKWICCVFFTETDIRFAFSDTS